jgi:hypothetical protein
MTGAAYLAITRDFAADHGHRGQAFHVKHGTRQWPGGTNVASGT